MKMIDGHQVICKLAVEGQKPKVVGINVPPGADWSGINGLISFTKFEIAVEVYLYRFLLTFSYKGEF